MRKQRKCVRPRVRDGKVWCPRCQRWLEPEAFGHRSDRPNGYAAYCRQCRVGRGGNSKDYQHAYYKAHRGAKVIRRRARPEGGTTGRASPPGIGSGAGLPAFSYDDCFSIDCLDTVSALKYAYVGCNGEYKT